MNENILQVDPKLKISIWDSCMVDVAGWWMFDLLLPLDVCVAIHKKTLNRVVTLRMKNGDWKVMLRREGPYPDLWLSSGWNDFVKANGQEVEDVSGVGESSNNTTTFEKEMVTALETKRGQLNIPTKFMRTNNIFKTCFKSARLKGPNGRMWSVKLNGDRKGMPKQRMGHGWYQFYEGNKLRIGDTCYFKLIGEACTTDYLFFDVSIVRL